MDDSLLESGENLEKDRRFVSALARGLDLLRCFQQGEVFLGNAEFARRTGLPKPTITRLTYTLTQLGYLNYSEETGKYRLGSGILALGYSMLSNLDIREVARPQMQSLADYSQTAVSLGVRDRLSMVYVETCRGNSALTLRLDIGSKIPLGSTAMGRALLCGLPQKERDYLIDHIRLRDENAWPKTKRGIEQAFKDYVDRGFCTAYDDWQKDTWAVGVPYISDPGQKAMAFTCGGLSLVLSKDTLENDLGPRLVKIVQNIKATVG